MSEGDEIVRLINDWDFSSLSLYGLITPSFVSWSLRRAVRTSHPTCYLPGPTESDEGGPVNLRDGIERC